MLDVKRSVYLLQVIYSRLTLFQLLKATPLTPTENGRICCIFGARKYGSLSDGSFYSNILICILLKEPSKKFCCMFLVTMLWHGPVKWESCKVCSKGSFAKSSLVTEWFHKLSYSCAVNALTDWTPVKFLQSHKYQRNISECDQKVETAFCQTQSRSAKTKYFSSIVLYPCCCCSFR